MTDEPDTRVDAAALHKALAPCYAIKNFPTTLEFGRDALRCVTTGRSFGVEVNVPCVSSGSLTATVNTQLLQRVLGTLSGELNFQIWGQGDHFVVVTDASGLTVTFPRHPEEDWASGAWDRQASSSDACDAIDRKVSAKSVGRGPDPTMSRVNIHAVCMEDSGNHLTIVATDGHRMAVSSRPSPLRFEETILVAPDVAKILPDGPLTMSVTKGSVFIESKTGRVWARRHKVTFPPYRAVIPAEVGSKGTPMIAVSSQAFFGAVSSFVKLRDGRSSKDFMRMEIDKKSLLLSSTGDPYDHAVGRTSVAWSGRPPCGSETNVNPDYVRDAQKVLADDRVRIYWSGRLDPIVFSDRPNSKTPGHNLVVVMPARI